MSRTHRILFPVVGALALLAFLTPEEAQAQRYGYGYGPRPQFGFRHRLHGYVGGEALGMGIVRQNTEGVGRLGPGGGFGLFGGIRLGPFVALELNWIFTVHDEDWEVNSLQQQMLTGDVKIHIPTRGIFEPYVQAGAGFAFMGVTGDAYTDGYIFQSGGTWSLGGGGDFWFSPWFTLGGRLLYRGIYYTDSDYGQLEPRQNTVHGVSFEVTAGIHF
jgi:hypothetical protein